MNLTTGVDLIEIQRLKDAITRHGNRLIEKIFTEREIIEAGDNPASLAARFAAKEAVAKALGTGIGIVDWLDIEIQRGSARQPILHLHGAAASTASEQGLTKWSISLSHSQSHAIAVVVAFGD